jgi:hypothetical protein
MSSRFIVPEIWIASALGILTVVGTVAVGQSDEIKESNRPTAGKAEAAAELTKYRHAAQTLLRHIAGDGKPTVKNPKIESVITQQGDLDYLYREGTVVWAAVVQAHADLFKPGTKPLPANVVWSADAYFDEHPDALVQIGRDVFKLKHAEPDDEQLRDVAKVVTDELNYVVNYELPQKLTRGRTVYLTTVMIARGALPNGILDRRYFPAVVAERAPRKIAVLPWTWWPRSIFAPTTQPNEIKKALDPAQ